MNWFSSLFETKTATRPSRQTLENPTDPGLADAAQGAEISNPYHIQVNGLAAARLKMYAPLRDLDDASLNALPQRSLWYRQGNVLFTIGQRTNSVLYLLSGQLQMQPDAENSYEITANSTLSALPLNCGSRYGATATANTEVRILEIPIELNRLWAEKCREDSECIELVDIQMPPQISGSRFFSSFAQAFRENKLRLPSLPDVALKLKDAIQNNVGVHDAAEIIQLDPAIVAKLIQVANSPLYTTGQPIGNCHDAVARIGLNATRTLVMSISLKQLFSCTDPELMKGMLGLWKNSLYVSSLSFVLAQECSNINPEDALLAGLIADIGAIPLMHYAEQFPDGGPSFAELEAALPYLRGPVGALTLHTLGFPDSLGNIPFYAENWLYDSGSMLTVTDIVILAKLHSYFGTGAARDLPFINSIPAYSKLIHGKLNPDFSLMVLKKAQSRVHAAMNFLS